MIHKIASIYYLNSNWTATYPIHTIGFTFRKEIKQAQEIKNSLLSGTNTKYTYKWVFPLYYGDNVNYFYGCSALVASARFNTKSEQGKKRMICSSDPY